MRYSTLLYLGELPNEDLIRTFIHQAVRDEMFVDRINKRDAILKQQLGETRPTDTATAPPPPTSTLQEAPDIVSLIFQDQQSRRSNETTAKHKRDARGTSPENRAADATLVADWNDAKSKKITKKEFAEERNMKVADVEKALDRERKRNSN